MLRGAHYSFRMRGHDDALVTWLEAGGAAAAAAASERRGRGQGGGGRGHRCIRVGGAATQHSAVQQRHVCAAQPTSTPRDHDGESALLEPCHRLTVYACLVSPLLACLLALLLLPLLGMLAKGGRRGVLK